MRYSIGDKIKTRINKIQSNGCFCSFIYKAGDEFGLLQNQFGFMPKHLMLDYYDEAGNITVKVGDKIDVVIKNITNRGIILSDIQTFEKEQIKKKEEKEHQHKLIEDFTNNFEIGNYFEVEVAKVRKNQVIIKLGELYGFINKEDTNWNEIDKLEDSVFEGEILKAVFIKYENYKLYFSTKLLNEKPYKESLYKLSLNELLKFIGHDTNIFIGKAKQDGKYTFIENLYSYSKSQKGKLLIDPIYGYNLRAIVPNANFNVEEGHFYKIALKLSPQNKRIARNQLFQFYATDFEETPNPYKTDVNLTFEKFTSPAGNVATAHLLEEVGKNMYSSKDRMFFELVQNADDAASEKGVRIKVKSDGDYLIVCHNGYSFDKDDFEAITSAANGTKKANEKKTGYKGIGFKSVFTDSDKVFIKTGGYQFKFDKSDKRFIDFDTFYFLVNRLTTDEQKRFFLQKYYSERSRFRGVTDIPWQLEPIWIDSYPTEFGDDFVSSNVAIALRLGENNIEGNNGYRQAIDEIINNPEFMLFLRNTKRIDFNNKFVSKEINDDTIILKNSFSSTRIEYFKRQDFEVLVDNATFENSGIDIRIKIEEEDKNTSKIIEAKFVDLYGHELENIPKKIAINNSTTISFAVSIQEDGSINPNTECNEISMFAFLPTLVKDFKFPFFINANFILDPPRQRILGDNPWNFYLMQEIAKNVVRWSASLNEKQDRNALNILIPKYFEESTTDTKQLAEHFNSAYRNALKSEVFILNHKGILSRQKNIIIDKTGLSDIIGANLFCKILGIEKCLPSNTIDCKILENDLFEDIIEVKFDMVIEAITNNSSFNNWYTSTSDDDKQRLYKWVKENNSNTHKDKLCHFVSHLPLFQFTDEFKSYAEISDSNHIITTEHIVPIKDILSKLGFKCSNDLLGDNFIFYDFIEREDEESLFQAIKVCDFSILDTEERLTLFCTLKDFNGVGDAKLKEIALFKNMNGDFKPLKEMVAYRKNYPRWLFEYVLSEADNDDSLLDYLINQEDEFSKIVKMHYDDFDVSLSELYETYRSEWSGDSTFTRHLIDNCDIDNEFLTIIEESDIETRKYFLNRIKRLNLSSTSMYKKTSYESRVLQLALSVLNEPSEFSSKVYFDNQCIKYFSVKDEVICEYTQDGGKKKVVMSLAKLLPQYENKSGSINRFKEILEIKKGLDSFFSAKVKPLADIHRELNLYLNIPERSFSQWNIIGNAQQFLFATYYRREKKGWNNLYVPTIELEKQSPQFINELITFLFENNIAIKESPFTYHLGKCFKGKYFDCDYIFIEEQLLPAIELWANNDDKRKFLIKNGVLDKTHKSIQFRQLFLENRPIPFVDKLSDDEIEASLDFISNVDGAERPFKGVYQKQALLKIHNDKKCAQIISRSDFTEICSISQECEFSNYNEWIKNHYPRIFLFDGECPQELLYRNTILIKFREGDMAYDSGARILYVSKERKLEDVLFRIAQEQDIPFDFEDFKKLCLDGKVSVSQEEIKTKDKLIDSLKRENQEKDKLLKKYRETYGDIESAKDVTTSMPNTKIAATSNVENLDKTIHLAKADTNTLSQSEQIEAQLEAQKKLRSVKHIWKFPDNFAEADEEGKPYCFSTFEITDEEGNDWSIVLKSYKREDAPFSINPEECDSILKHKARILIYRGNDIVEIEKEDLVKNQNSIILRFSTENLDVEDRISQFSDLLHHFKQIHFDFESFNVSKRAKSIIGITNKNQGTQIGNNDEDL